MRGVADRGRIEEARDRPKRSKQSVGPESGTRADALAACIGTRRDGAPVGGLRAVRPRSPRSHCVFGLRKHGISTGDRSFAIFFLKSASGHPDRSTKGRDAMSEIRIRRTHGVPHKRAREQAEKMASKLAKDFDLEWEWHGDVLKFHRDGVQGQVAVDDKDVEIRAKLGFLLSFLKPRIESEIEDNLDKLFGDAHRATKPRTLGDVAKKPAKKPATKRG
jgi:putative polyhydroxyalkanoate system protein